MLPDNFIFAVQVLAGAPRFSQILGEVAAGVLRQAGYGEPIVEDVMEELREALSGAASAGDPYDLRFRADAGQLHVEVARAATALWRTSRALP